MICHFAFIETKHLVIRIDWKLNSSGKLSVCFFKITFGFASHEEQATYGLGYKLTLQKNIDNHNIGHEIGSNDAVKERIVTSDIIWLVSH